MLYVLHKLKLLLGLVSVFVVVVSQNFYSKNLFRILFCEASFYYRGATLSVSVGLPRREYRSHLLKIFLQKSVALPWSLPLRWNSGQLILKETSFTFVAFPDSLFLILIRAYLAVYHAFTALTRHESQPKFYALLLPCLQESN